MVNFDKIGKATYLDLISVQSPKWESLAEFNRRTICNAAVCCCCDCLYALGGLDTSVSPSRQLKSEELLPGLIMKRQDVVPMKAARVYFTAVSYKRYIFAIVWYDLINDDRLKSVDMFDSIKLTIGFCQTDVK